MPRGCPTTACCRSSKAPTASSGWAPAAAWRGGAAHGRSFAPALVDVLGDRSIYTLFRDSAGWTWAGTGRGLLVRWRGDDVEVVPTEPGDDAVRDILEDRDGNVWVAIDPGGVRRLTPHGWESYRRRDGLPVDRALSLLEDREGNLWIGTSGGGLQELSVGAAVAFGGPRHPLSASVLPIVDDGAGGIWAGLVCGGLAHLDAAGQVQRLAEADGLTNSCVASLLRTATGELWIGTMGGGLFLFRDGQFRPIDLPPSGKGMVRALLAGRDGLLVGTDHGLYRSRGDPRRPDARFELLPGSRGLDIYALTEDAAGTLWIGALRGVWLQPPGSDRVEPLPAAPDSLRAATVRTIYPDAGGALWFGTYGRGLYRLHDGRFTHFGRREGLAEEIVSLLVEDRRGRFWMTGNRGVQRVPRRDLEALAAGRLLRVRPILFGADDGMPVSETNGGGQPAGMLSADGALWVPTADGVARFDTLADATSHAAPPVHIEAVTVDGRELDPALLAGPAPVELGAGVRNLEIHYTALAFTAPSRVHFRYRLADEDAEWLDVGTRRVAYYPFLPPGRHRFQVTASDEDGSWGSETAGFAFNVAPRFVETPLLPLVVVVAVALAVLIGSRLRLRALRKREHRLAAEVAARTAELEDTRADLERANLRLSRLANLDALTGIPNRRGLMERVGAEWRRSLRQHRPLGLLMIDLDQFKAYNDLHGHPAGDRCLQRVVEILESSLRRADEMLARYGGEELLAMVPEVPSTAALEELAEMLRRRVEEARIPHGGSVVGEWVTVSIGGAVVVPTLDSDLEALLATADAALYRAKQRGRNRVEVVAAGEDADRVALGAGVEDARR